METEANVFINNDYYHYYHYHNYYFQSPILWLLCWGFFKTTCTFTCSPVLSLQPLQPLSSVASGFPWQHWGGQLWFPWQRLSCFLPGCERFAGGPRQSQTRSNSRKPDLLLPCNEAAYLEVGRTSYTILWVPRSLPPPTHNWLVF